MPPFPYPFWPIWLFSLEGVATIVLARIASRIRNSIRVRYAARLLLGLSEAEVLMIEKDSLGPLDKGHKLINPKTPYSRDMDR